MFDTPPRGNSAFNELRTHPHVFIPLIFLKKKLDSEPRFRSACARREEPGGACGGSGAGRSSLGGRGAGSGTGSGAMAGPEAAGAAAAAAEGNEAGNGDRDGYDGKCVFCRIARREEPGTALLPCEVCEGRHGLAQGSRLRLGWGAAALRALTSCMDIVGEHRSDGAH